MDIRQSQFLINNAKLEV